MLTYKKKTKIYPSVDPKITTKHNDKLLNFFPKYQYCNNYSYINTHPKKLHKHKDMFPILLRLVKSDH